MSPLVQRARDFAIKAHGDQKYGTKPYAYHLGMAHSALVAAGFLDEDLQAAIWLHDVEEDTGKTREEVRAEFGEDVEALVWAVSGFGATRKERNAASYEKVLLEPRSIIVKLADHIANGTECAAGNPKLLGMYQREFPSFHGKLSPLLAGDSRVIAMWAKLREILGVV